jgi:CRISPR/Cas system CSM-associated protein Csm2 small subunit
MKKGGSVSPTSKGQNFVEICNLHDFDYDTSLDDILSAEIIRRNQEDPDNQFSEENLPFIRICEIDCIILDDWGLSSFDSKGAKGPGWQDNPDQAAMQRPDFLRPEPYFSISCTDPPDDFSQQNVVHISRLHRGRQVLSDPHKHRWDPSQFIDGEEISCTWDEYKVKAEEAHDENKKKQEEVAQEEADKLERKKQEIIEKITIINPNFEADNLSLTKLKALYKEEKKTQLEAEESPKIIEELQNLDPELELENLTFPELRKLLKNMKRRKRKRRDKKNPSNYPCPHCNKVCNGEDQLKEHVSAKHPNEEE